MELGRHENIPAAVYHASEGLGSTAIRTIAEHSVAHYLAKKETPAMRKGSINHTAVLEPEKFDQAYVVAPRGPCPKCPSGRRSMVGAVHCHQHGGKQESEEWHAQLPPGTEVIDADEKQQAMELAIGVHWGVGRSEYPKILDGAKEVSYCAVAMPDGDGYRIATLDLGKDDREFGIVVRARVDIDWPGLCVDLKGVSRLDMLQPRKWAWRILDHGLHIQAALYTDIVEAVTGERPVWGWLVHQSAEPYATRLFQAAEEDVEIGRIAVAEALRRWQVYQDNGDAWAGWPTEREVVSMPKVWKEEG
jgi:hypothetical protein